MVTYVILNIVFIAALIVFLRIPVGVPRKKRLVIVAILLALTIVFDSLLVGFGIVAYDADKILQLYVGAAPVEDLFYSLCAALLIPFLWNFFERKK